MSLHRGATKGQSGGSEGKTWARTFILVSVGKNEQGREAALGLASLSNFSRLWAIVSGTWHWSD